MAYTEITEPKIDSYMDRPTIKIPIANEKPLTMGVFKTKMLMKELPEIRMSLIQHRNKKIDMNKEPYAFSLEGKFPFRLDINADRAEALIRFEGKIMEFVNANEREFPTPRPPRYRMFP